MAARDAIYDMLRASVVVTTLVAARIYTSDAPQNATRPYIVWGQLNKQTDVAHDGVTGLARYVFEVHCVADTQEEAVALAAAVGAALDPEAAAAHEGIGVVLPEDEFDLSEFTGSGGEERIKTIVQQYIVWAP